MIDQLKEAYSYRSFLWQLVYQLLNQRYNGSFLGFLWTLLVPLATFVSFTVIFSVLNHQNVQDYGIYFLSGYLLWTLFSSTSTLAAESIVGNAVLVTRVRIPKILLPLASVAVCLIDLAAGLVILLGLMAVLGAHFSASLAFLPVGILLSIIFVTGVALISAVANVFFRDFRHLLNSLLFIWFFFSPVLWKAKTAPPDAKWFLALNPIVPFLQFFQEPVWAGALPGQDVILLGSALAFGTLFVGVVLFLDYEKKFFYYL